MKKVYLFLCIFFVFVGIAYALSSNGNTTNDSFTQAKKWLEKQVYDDHRITLYCGAKFNVQKQIELPVGFTSPKYESRSNRIEWEHVVPAENFGRTFTEWREGHTNCIDNNGKSFKGRKCAELINKDYRLMQADMYNLYPAIGSVNAMRQNYNFTQFEKDTPNTFGSCAVKIQDKKVEPPPSSRGTIARTYLYFERVYSRYKMSEATRKLMESWDRQYPVDSWECERSCRIQKIQKNTNTVVKDRCVSAHLWGC